MIGLTASVVGAAEVQSRLLGSSARVREGVRRTVATLGAELQRRVKEKLSDDALHVRTGRLRRSINLQLLSSDNESSASVGTAVAYARRHELGFSGTENVRAFTRRTPSGKTANVRAFTRRANTPARPFLRPALEEMRVRCTHQLASAMRGAV